MIKIIISGGGTFLRPPPFDYTNYGWRNIKDAGILEGQ